MDHELLKQVLLCSVDTASLYTLSTCYVLTKDGYCEEPALCPGSSDGCQIVWALKETERARVGPGIP